MLFFVEKSTFNIEDNESYDDSIMIKKALSSDTDNRKKVSKSTNMRFTSKHRYIIQLF